MPDRNARSFAPCSRSNQSTEQDFVDVTTGSPTFPPSRL
jgi:hypothetical protein